MGECRGEGGYWGWDCYCGDEGGAAGELQEGWGLRGEVDCWGEGAAGERVLLLGPQCVQSRSTPLWPHLCPSPEAPAHPCELDQWALI